LELAAPLPTNTLSPTAVVSCVADAPPPALEFCVVWTLAPGPVAAAIVKATLSLLSTARVPLYSPLPVAPPKLYVSAVAMEQQNTMDNRKIPATIEAVA
jgi:hypothetical protein